MKQVIKIGLILIVAAALAFAIKASLAGLADENSALLKSQDFETVITAQIDSIKGDYHPAKRTYDRIMGAIKTEEFITLSNGSNAISKDVAKKCRDKANDKFAPIFTDYATKYFDKASWDQGEVTAMQTTSKEMLASVGADSKHAGVLKTINTTANGFLTAINVIAKASNCSSVSEALNVKKQAAACNGYTLPANTRQGLNSAPATAQQSVLSAIISQCNRANSCKQAQNALNNANAYINAFGYTSALDGPLARVNEIISYDPGYDPYEPDPYEPDPYNSSNPFR